MNLPSRYKPTGAAGIISCYQLDLSFFSSMGPKQSDTMNKEFKLNAYGVLLSLDIGDITPEQAQEDLMIQIDEAVEKSSEESMLNNADDSEVFRSPFNNLPNGLYAVYWKTGGFSLASMGCFKDGKRWISPTNWVSEVACGGTLDIHADSISKMVLLHNEKSTSL